MNDTIKELNDYFESEKRIERRYFWIMLGTMAACFVLGILIGGKL
jgi:uncharacterized membrane protein YhaH (DUF805 family)